MRRRPFWSKSQQNHANGANRCFTERLFAASWSRYLFLLRKFRKFNVFRPPPPSRSTVLQPINAITWDGYNSHGMSRLIYIFRLMTCEQYYKFHDEPPASSTTDKCSVHTIEASTAIAISILGFSTTIFGVLNLFVTGWTIRKFGVKSALFISVFWPAVRLCIQNIGVYVGYERGILIIQSSQIITIIGGPAGYMLALNTFVTEVIEHEERTGALGRLQGAALFGTSIGYLFGGLISDWYGIQAPFMVTVGLFCISCAYVAIGLPWIPLREGAVKKTSGGLMRFFGPLKTFAPQKWIKRDGRVGYEYGALLLGIGVFFGKIVQLDRTMFLGDADDCCRNSCNKLHTSTPPDVRHRYSQLRHNRKWLHDFSHLSGSRPFPHPGVSSNHQSRSRLDKTP